jgi:hypothetical protein
MQPAVHSVGEESDVCGVIVQARDLLKAFTTGREKRGPTGNGDFFRRFEAVGHEGGADHEESFHANGRQTFQLRIRERLQPGFTGESGLK